MLQLVPLDIMMAMYVTKSLIPVRLHQAPILGKYLLGSMGVVVFVSACRGSVFSWTFSFAVMDRSDLAHVLNMSLDGLQMFVNVTLGCCDDHIVMCFLEL